MTTQKQAREFFFIEVESIELLEMFNSFEEAFQFKEWCENEGIKNQMKIGRCIEVLKNDKT